MQFPRFLTKSAVVLLLVGTVVGALRSLFGIYTVRGESMLPTLPPGSRVLVRRHVIARRLRRGSVVVLHLGRGTTAVKRLIGLPGDGIAVVANRVSVNGRLAWVTGDRGSVGHPTFVSAPVPPGFVFVLSDSLAGGADSRVVGPIQQAAILGVGVGYFDVTGQWQRLRLAPAGARR